MGLVISPTSSAQYIIYRKKDNPELSTGESFTITNLLCVGTSTIAGKDVSIRRSAGGFSVQTQFML